MPAHADVIARYCGEAEPLRQVAMHHERCRQELVIVGRDAPVWLVGLRDAVRARARGRACHGGRAAADALAAATSTRSRARARSPARAAAHREVAAHRGNTRRFHAGQTLPRYDRPGAGVFPRVWLHGRAHRQQGIPAEVAAGAAPRTTGGVRGFLPDGGGGEAGPHAGAGRGDRAASGSPTTAITCRPFRTRAWLRQLALHRGVDVYESRELGSPACDARRDIARR